MAAVKLAPMYLSGLRRAGARNLPVSVMSMRGRRVSSFHGTVNARVPSGFCKIVVVRFGVGATSWALMWAD